MARVTIGTEDGSPIELHDEDHGEGQPIVLIHGAEDRSLSFEAIATRIADLRLLTVEGGPHNIGWTQPEETTTALLEFLAHGSDDRHQNARGVSDACLASA